MNRFLSRIFSRLFLFAPLFATVATASGPSGGTFSLPSSVIDADGGGLASGGTFALQGTLGQSMVREMTGGEFTLYSGFWTEITLGVPHNGLRVSRNGAHVVLHWPSSLIGYHLEYSPLPFNGGWSTVYAVPSLVNGENEVTLLPTGGTGGLFRLAKP